MKELIKRKVTYNTKIFDSYIFPVVDNKDDYHFIANQMSKLYREVSCAGCVDQARTSKDYNGEWDDNFTKRITCCGCTNRLIENPYTGNKFWIGFNYGH